MFTHLVPTVVSSPRLSSLRPMLLILREPITGFLIMLISRAKDRLYTAPEGGSKPPSYFTGRIRGAITSRKPKTLGRNLTDALDMNMIPQFPGGSPLAMRIIPDWKLSLIGTLNVALIA